MTTSKLPQTRTTRLTTLPLSASNHPETQPLVKKPYSATDPLWYKDATGIALAQATLEIST